MVPQTPGGMKMSSGVSRIHWLVGLSTLTERAANRSGWLSRGGCWVAAGGPSKVRNSGGWLKQVVAIGDWAALVAAAAGLRGRRQPRQGGRGEDDPRRLVDGWPHEPAGRGLALGVEQRQEPGEGAEADQGLGRLAHATRPWSSW